MALPYKISKLDANQVLQHAYDDASMTLRTSARFDIDSVAFEVSIDAASGDNISIASKDGTKYLFINPDGSINVKNLLHDDFNVNANLQVNNTDISGANPVPTYTINGALEATQLQVLSKVTSIDNKIFNNYGVATQAIRTASQIGNVNGAADFNEGPTGVQTLRTVSNQGLPNALANAWPIKITDGTDTTVVKVVKEEMQYTNADFGLPIYGVDRDVNPRKYHALRVDSNGNVHSHIIDKDQNQATVTPILTRFGLDVNVLQSALPNGAATETTLSSINNKLTNNYGVATAALRTAAQLGNANGQADFNQGASTAQTLRTASNISDSAGTSLNSYANQLQTADIVVATGTQSALTIGTTAVEVKVGATALANRKLVTVYNNSLVTIYFGRTSSVTITSGTPIFAGQFFSFEGFSATQAIYLIAGTAGNNVRITES